MLVFDRNRFGSKREIDSNGYLRVSACNITKAQVRIYYGKEIPNWRDFNLDPDKIYNVYCPAEELKKALETFNNLPLTREHIEVNVNNVPKDKIVGSLGDSAQFKNPYVQNSLIVYDQKDIDWIMSGRKRELSCGYTYTPVQQSGEFNGLPYDFIMTDIVGNHVALVKEGRAGHDVMVADENIVYDVMDKDGRNHDKKGWFCEKPSFESFEDLENYAEENNLIEPFPEKYKGNTAEDVYKELGLGDKNSTKIVSPIEDVTITRGNIHHLVEENNPERKTFLFSGIATIERPTIVVKEEKDGKEFHKYFKVFSSGDKNKPFVQIVRNAPDGNFYTTMMRMKLSQVSKKIKGQVIYYSPFHPAEEGRSSSQADDIITQDSGIVKDFFDEFVLFDFGKKSADDSIRLKMNGLNSRSAEENKLTSDEDIISQGYGVVNIFFADEEELPNFTENENNNKLLDKGEESMVNDEFKEADHPRDKDGRFTDKSSSGAGSSFKDDKDVDNYWQGTGSKESQEAGTVKVMQKQLEDLKKMHKEILGKPGFVSLEDQERAHYIEKDIKKLEEELGKHEKGGEGSEKKEVSQEKAEEYAKWWNGLSEQDKKDAVMGIASKDPKIKELMGEKLFKELSEGKKESNGSEKKEESKESAVEKMYKKLSEQGMKGEALEQAIYEKHGWEGVEEAKMISEYESGNPKHSLKEQESLVKSLKEDLDGYKKIVSNFERDGETGLDYQHYKNMVERQEGALKKAESQLDWIKRHTKKETTNDEIPAKAGKPEKAGEEEALTKGEEKMAEEVKEAVAEKVKETKEEKEVEDACGKGKDAKGAKDAGIDKRKLIDEIGGILKGKLEEELWRTVMKKAEELAYNDSERSADDKKTVKDEAEKDLKGKEKEAFAEGVDFGEKKEKEEPKKLDSEHESEGTKKADEKEEKAEDKKEAKDKCTMDSQLAMDIDAIKAQVREEVMADFKARENARKAVRSIVGDVNVMAFDSAEEIYKFACEKAGMDLNEIVSFKDAFRGLSAAKGSKLALDASPISGSNEECFKGIRIA